MKILLVKTSAIGDVIQTFPVLQYLREKFPNAQIDWVVEQSILPLLKSHPMIDRAIPFDSKRWRRHLFSRETRLAFSEFKKELCAHRYDLLVDLQGNAKSAVATLCADAQEKIGFDWKSAREKCNVLATRRRFFVPADWNVRKKYLSLLQQFFGDKEPFHFSGIRLSLTAEEKQRLDAIDCSKPTFMVCFGSRWQNKQLSPAGWSDFLMRISAQCDPHFIFIYGDAEEKKQAEAFCSLFPSKAQCVGELSLPLWQALMWKVDKVLAVDSAALHLCGTTATPSFSLFGPSLASVYRPMEARHHSYQGACPYGVVFEQRCPRLRTCASGACLRPRSGEELFYEYLRSRESSASKSM